MPWSDYPLESLEIPGDHGPTDPYIYIGTGDPIAVARGQDASEVFHFGTHNSAFLLGVDDSSTGGADIGNLQVLAVSDQNAAILSIMQFLFNAQAQGYTLYFGNTQPNVITNLMGDKININDLGQGTHFEPFDVGPNSGFYINMSGHALSQFSVTTANTQVNNSLIDVNGHDYHRGENGSKTVSFTSVNSSLISVTFAIPFTNTPKVLTNINSNAGATAQWHSRAVNITTSGFQILVFAASAGTWSNVEVQWSAEEPT